jgi:hypothetical protein
MKDPTEDLARAILVNWCRAGLVTPRVEGPAPDVLATERALVKCDVASAFLLAETFREECNLRDKIAETQRLAAGGAFVAQDDDVPF